MQSTNRLWRNSRQLPEFLQRLWSAVATVAIQAVSFIMIILLFLLLVDIPFIIPSKNGVG